jgi:hypothetical protein
MRYALLGVLALALLGCKERQTAHDAAMSVAEDAAEDAVLPVKENVTALNERIGMLEEGLRREGAYVKKVHAALDEERENRVKDVDALRSHYNDHLRRFHGDQ